MKKIISLLLVLVLAFSLAACGNKGPELLGTYRVELDATDYVAEIIEAEFAASGMELELDEYMKPFVIAINITFNEDGTYKQTLDVEMMESGLLDMIHSIADAMNDVVFDLLVEALAAEGIYIESVEELEELVGMSFNEIIVSSFGTDIESLMLENFDAMDIQAEFAALQVEGKFEAKDGKLYSTESLDEEINHNCYEIYEINGSEVTFVGSENIREELDILQYPYTMVKVS